MREYFCGYASKHYRRNPASSVRSHHNEVAAFLLCRGNYRPVGVIMNHLIGFTLHTGDRCDVDTCGSLCLPIPDGVTANCRRIAIACGYSHDAETQETPSGRGRIGSVPMSPRYVLRDSGTPKGKAPAARNISSRSVILMTAALPLGSENPSSATR